MAIYDIIPGVDENYEFPPEIRNAILKSAGLQSRAAMFEVDQAILPMKSWLRSQMEQIVIPEHADAVVLDREYPVDYTGPVTASWNIPELKDYATSPGTPINVADPADISASYRGMVYGGLTGITNPQNYKIVAVKKTDANYDTAAYAIPNNAGQWGMDLSVVPTYMKGEWGFRLELASAPGVAVGGLWPADGPVYQVVDVELRAISDDDSFVRRQPAPKSGVVTFLSSTPGEKRVVLRHRFTNEVMADSRIYTGNIRSFLVKEGEPGYGTRFPEQSYVYDQAVALAAITAMGDHTMARDLMEGLFRLQTNGGTHDGGFRFSGRQWSANYGDPAYRTGAHAYAVHAALLYVQMWPQEYKRYYDRILRGIQWLDRQLVTQGNRAGLYLGGAGTYIPDGGGGQSFDELRNITWASTEHNIDAYFVFRLAGQVLNPSYTNRAEALANVMMQKLWNPSLQRMNQGVQEAGPDTADALDCHSWGAIFLSAIGEHEKAAHIMSEESLAPFRFTRTAPNGNQVTGYAGFYNSPGYEGALPLTWWEGSFGVAEAFWKIRDFDRWQRTLAEMMPGQFDDGSFPYVSNPDPTYEVFTYKSVASTAWGIIAWLGGGILDDGIVKSRRRDRRL